MLDTAREWYLFGDQLPDRVDPASIATAADLLDALTAEARAEGKDRFFSYLTTRQADDAILQAGQFIGFGFRTRIEGDRLWLTDVYEDSPAEDGGLARGVEITDIDSGSGFVPVATVLANDPELDEAFGPATEGIERGIRFILPGGAAAEAVFAKRIVEILPVPRRAAPRSSRCPRTRRCASATSACALSSTAEAPLRDAYAEFRAQGIEYFIVDLRYNSGGLVSIAELIGDLNGGARDNRDVYLEMRFNDRPSPGKRRRAALPARGPNRWPRCASPSSRPASPRRRARLSSTRSRPGPRSRSLATIPWASPSASAAFDLSGCDLRLRLISFQFTNADGQGEYYEGLASPWPSPAGLKTT